MARITVVGTQRPAIEDDPLERPKRPVSYFSGLSGSGVRGSIDPRKLAPRLPTPFGETVGTALDESLGRQSFAIESEVYDEYESYIGEIDERLGKGSGLLNPYSPEPGRDRDTKLKFFYNQLTELSQTNPGLPLRTQEDILAAVAEKRRQVGERRAIAQAGETGLASALGSFIGSSGGALSDPIVLPTLFLGAPWSAGVLRFAVTEAALGAGGTAVAQTAFQTARRQVGEEPSLREALEETAIAGVGAGLFGGLLKGGAAGAARLRAALQDRRMRLQMAEALPPQLKTLDVEAAIAVERRMLDIEDASPFGRDVAAQSVHGQRYAAAERALAEGRILPRSEAIDRITFAHLSDLDKQAVSELVRIANGEPEKFTAWIEALKALPGKDVQQAETFAQFVQRQGGIAADDPALRRLGVSPEIDPVLFRGGAKTGNTLDQLAKAAKRQGFFAEKPTHEQIVSVLRDEIENGRPLHRIDMDTGVPVSPARQVGVLDRLDLPFRDLEPREVATRLRAISEAEAASRAPQRNIRDLRDGELHLRARARADDERLVREAETKEQAELDDARERMVRELYAGREDTVLIFENPDGTIERMTARDMFERNKIETDELQALSVCLGNRRT